MTERLDHVERPRLPWQTERLTECGRLVEDFAPDLILDGLAYVAKVKRLGQQRTAMTTCMTCVGRASYSPPSWTDNPAAVMLRHCQRAGWSSVDDRPINVELRALALLVEAHRDEFEQAIRDLTDMTSLSAVRRTRTRKATR